MNNNRHTTLVSPSLITWISVSMSQKSLPKQLRHLVSFAGTLVFAPTCMSTKEVSNKTLVRPKPEYAAPFWSSHSKVQINQIEKVQRTAAAGPAGDGET